MFLLFFCAGEIAVASSGGVEEGEPLASGAQPGAGEGGGGAQEDHHAPGGAVQPEAGPARCVPRVQAGCVYLCLLSTINYISIFYSL